MTIEEIIKKLADNKTLYLQTAKVIEVNEETRSVDVEPLNGEAILYDARLQANLSGVNGLVAIPAINSYVTIGHLNGHIAVVLLCSEIEKFIIEIESSKIEVEKDEITINGGSKGGLVEISELQKQVHKNSNAIETIKSAIETAPIAPSDGGAAFKASVIASIASIQTADLSEIANEKIKHG